MEEDPPPPPGGAIDPANPVATTRLNVGSGHEMAGPGYHFRQGQGFTRQRPGQPRAPPPLKDENPWCRRAEAGETWCGSESPCDSATQEPVEPLIAAMSAKARLIPRRLLPAAHTVDPGVRGPELTAGKQGSDLGRHLACNSRSPSALREVSRSRRRARLLVGEAFRLSFFERRLLDEDPLTLVAAAGAAVPDDHWR